MRRLPRIVYGWATPAGVCLSHIPPDVAQVPRHVFASVAAAEAYLLKLNAERRRQIEVIWSGSALAEHERLAAIARTGTHADYLADR